MSAIIGFTYRKCTANRYQPCGRTQDTGPDTLVIGIYMMGSRSNGTRVDSRNLLTMLK